MQEHSLDAAQHPKLWENQPRCMGAHHQGWGAHSHATSGSRWHVASPGLSWTSRDPQFQSQTPGNDWWDNISVSRCRPHPVGKDTAGTKNIGTTERRSQCDREHLDFVGEMKAPHERVRRQKCKHFGAIFSVQRRPRCRGIEGNGRHTIETITTSQV